VEPSHWCAYVIIGALTSYIFRQTQRSKFTSQL